MIRALAALGRLLRALIALAVLGGFLTGVPWLLVQVVGWPVDWIGWPTAAHLPGLGDIVTAVTNPWSDDKILAIFATLGWVLWLQFCRDVVIEIIETAADAAEARRGRTRESTAARGPVRWVAAVLVGAIAGAILFDTLRGAISPTQPGSAAAAAAADAAARRPAIAVVALAPARPAAITEAPVQAGPRPALAANATAVTSVVAPMSGHVGADHVPAWAREAPGGVHHVVKYDNLWDIAHHELGDPHRWREIYVLNRGQVQANGYALTDPDEIHIGWVLALPANDPVPIAPVAEHTEPPTHTEPATQTAPVAHVAPASPVPNPTALLTANSSANAGTATLVIRGCGYAHKVAKNESLSRIAAQCLGDADRWPEIFSLNKGRHWPKVSGHTDLSNPNLIFPGWVLMLPDDAIPPPGAQPVDPPTTAPPTSAPTPSQSAAPSPTVSAPVTAPGVVVPGVTPTETATTATSTPTGSSQVTTTASAPAQSPPPSGAQVEGSEQSAADSSFVEVVGGFISVSLAAGLLFAVAMVWRRRRQRYRPTPIDQVELDDPDLAPPMAALTHLRQAVRRNHPELLNTPVVGPTVREYAAADVKPALPLPGPTGAELAGVMHLPVSAGLGLDGPGALDAARGLLVASLTAGSPDDPDAQGQVVIPGSTLATLLGISTVDLPRMRRLTITANTGDAITEVEEEIIRRTRIVTDHDVDDIAALREAHPLAEPLPQLLLLCDVPEPRQQQRLANAIRLGEKVDIGAVLIGEWTHGATLTVAANGASSGDDATSRVTVLDTDAATAVLTMLAEAHGDSPTVKIPNVRLPPPAAARPPALDTNEPIAVPPARVPAQRSVPAPPQHADGAQDERVQIRVLGDPVILGRDGQPMRGLRGKSVELLVYLAVHRDGAALSDIMEALWPEATWRRASERLSNNVGNLRSVLRAAHPSADTDPDGSGTATTDDKAGADKAKAAVRKPDPIPNTGSRYHLDPAFVQVDWWTVLDEYTRVATASDDQARLHHLMAAVTTVSGPLASGQEYDWIDTDREHVRRQLIKLHAHAAELLGDDDSHQARILYDSACLLDPLSDELARRAMRAAAAVGDADGVRHRLHVLRQALEDASLDIDDSTEQLAAELLRELAPPNRADQ
jgi:nucleoid-associated protein YgaU/DNA-binding SARP family transcriptional activator